MNFKQFSTSDNQWHDIPHYIHKTATDTLTLPATLYPNDTSITVGLKGNEEHTGTPTPDNPIMPQGTGERTGNLFDGTKYEKTSILSTEFWEYATTLTGSVYCVPCKPNTTYTLYLTENIDITIWRIRCVSTNAVPNAQSTRVPLSGSYANTVPASKSATFTTSSDAKYILFQTNEAAYADVLPVIMLVEGTTKIPYEPYGYKLTISSANTTTPVYLGEVETTRIIKKYIFDGSEQWQRATNGAYYLASSVAPITDFWHDLSITSVNSHFAAQENVTGSSSVSNNKSAFYGGSALGTKEYYIAARDIADATSFKSYLQQQYANGTPVTVWYVLATEETGIVNEPLMRIGDYADTVSGISIPVTAGGDTLSVGTTVQPSEVTVNYKGWHPVQNVHERDNGAWT